MNRNEVLITGGAGFIGSKLLHFIQSRLALLNSFKIVVVDKGLFGVNHIKNLNIKFFHKPLSQFVDEYDFRNVKAIIHLSGLSNDPMADFSPEANHKLNYVDTQKIVDKACETRIPRFIYASSASVYGMYDDTLVSEEHEINPQSAYAQSKKMSEDYIIVKSRLFENFNPVILRKSTVMGTSPRMRFDLVVNTMVMMALRFKRVELWGGGENWRPLVSINDVVRLYYEFAISSTTEFYKRAAEYEIFNIVQGNYRISELGLRIGNWLGVPVIPDYKKSPDKRSYRLSGERAKSILDFTPQFNLEQTVFSVKKYITQNKPNLDDSIFYNIRFIKNCQRVCDIMKQPFDLTQ